MITISKFLYKNKESKIKIHFPLNQNELIKLKQIESFRYSKTHKCWHIPYNKIAYNKLKNIFPEITVENLKQTKPTKNIILTIDKEYKSIYLSQFYNKELFIKIKQIEGSFWQKDRKQWIIKETNENFVYIKNLLKQYKYIIKIEYKKTLIEQETEPKVKLFMEALKMKNYSINTIESYLPFFKEFINNFKNYDTDNLTLSQLKEYVADTILFKDLSETQSKHLISAIKFYYEKILGLPKIYFTLTQKYEFRDGDFNISIKELLPFIKQTDDYREKLLILLHFSQNYNIENLTGFLLEDLKTFVKSQKNTENYNIIKIIVIKYYEIYKPKKFVFENNNIPLSEIEIKAEIDQVDKTEFAIIRFKNIMKKIGLAEITQKNYLSSFKSYLRYFNFKHPKNVSDLEIKEYLFECKEKLKLSTSYINNQINSIKFYYINIENRKIEYKYLFRPRREKKLPTVLSPNEVFEMINVTENLKHKNIIALLYSSGLRRSELLNLKIHDIDFQRDVIIVRQGKGRKDRQTLLSENFKTLLKKYLEEYKPKDYLFEGENGGRYSETSLRKIIKKATQKSKINKNVTPHTLRHSFATHLLENSLDIRYIQELLGHNSIKTTERYTHVANTTKRKIKSPLDNFNFEENENKPP